MLVIGYASLCVMQFTLYSLFVWFARDYSLDELNLLIEYITCCFK